MNENALEWLKSAKDDIDTMEELLRNPNLTNIVSFHAQQAVEKCFKAVIESREIEIQKTHNLLKLYDHIQEDIDLEEKTLSLINELYIDSRYPGDFGLLPDGKPSMAEAESFYNFALSMYRKIEQLLSLKK